MGGPVNFNRLDIQQYEQDMDIFLDTAFPDDAISVSSSQMWEDWDYLLAMSKIDHRYSFPPNASVIGDQEEHKLFDDTQHEDQMRKDLRSASIPYKRDADQGQKYYYFKAVKRGDLGQAYYTAPDGSSRLTAIGLEMLPADHSEAKVEVWTKRSLFTQAQGYPRPPRHHRHCRGCNEGRNAWTKRQAYTSDIRQTLKVSPVSISEEDWLIDLDVITESLGDDWNYPSQAHTHSDPVAVEEKNNEIAGYIVDRAVIRWKTRRCKSSGTSLSVVTSGLSSPSWDCLTLSDTFEEVAVDGAWELLPLL